MLKELSVSHVVNCAKEIPCYHPRDLEYLHLDFEDDADEDVARDFDRVTAFIKSARGSGNTVAVNCQAGISRSVTFVLAYLMKEEKYSLRDAYFLVKVGLLFVFGRETKRHLLHQLHRRNGRKLAPMLGTGNI